MSAAGREANPAICLRRRVDSPRGDQRGREQRTEEQPQAGADQACLDRIFDQEDAAERERHAADPDRPAGAEFFLEADDALGSASAGGGVGGAGSVAGGGAGRLHTRGFRCRGGRRRGGLRFG